MTVIQLKQGQIFRFARKDPIFVRYPAMEDCVNNQQKNECKTNLKSFVFAK